MTAHFYEHPLVSLHYYVFGTGPKKVLCFHGYGMHGKQFQLLESQYGEETTFYGFDLFFHKETKLKDESLPEIKRGISKAEIYQLFTDFRAYAGIDRFSMIAYSMGTHYASALAELGADRVDTYIAIAPSTLRPPPLVILLGRNKLANLILEKLILSDTGMLRLLALCHKVKLVDDKALEILTREINTPELRFSFYACTTYLRFLTLDRDLFARQLNRFGVKTVFIFGRTDSAYPSGMSPGIPAELKNSTKLILNGGHELINPSLAAALTKYL